MADPVSDVVAVDRRTGAAMCDKYDAEALNLLKIDALGLTQLSVFEDALGLISSSTSYVAWPQRGPFNDPKAFHILNTRRFAGIFQFNGPALQNLCTQVTVASFDDIVALTALARPGPLDSGEAQRWIGVKVGKTRSTTLHPLFDPILQPTLGVVIYQEQVMQIARAVGMSWEEVSALRRLISKSAGPEALEAYHDSFQRHGAEACVPDAVLADVWRILQASGAYSFNKSHAVAYAIISYWCCWLKAHHPLEFAAATLTHAGDDMQLKLLRELSKEGVRYVAADRAKSTSKWTVADVDGERKLIGPLRNIIGIGPQHERSILSQRVRPIERLPEHVGKILSRMRTKVDDLWPIKSAIESLMSEQLKQDLVSRRSDIIDIQPNGQPYVVRVEGLIDSLKKISENSPDRIARRQGRRAGGEYALNLWIEDDTDKIFAKVSWDAFQELGEEILLRGKGYYSIRGTVPADFRMIRVEKFRFIGKEGTGHAKDIAAE
jgi:DNA polymerase III alpha subunit